MTYYSLDADNNVIEVPEADVSLYGTEEGNARRRVAAEDAGGYRVSTVFLAIDHQFGDGPPLLFETMIFGDGPLDQHCERYSTWAEAEEGHRKCVKMALEEAQKDTES